MNNIRWKQRFENFERSVKNLEKALNIKTPDEVYRAGIIQLFEISFELAWKTLKDFLEVSGYLVKSPRETIQQSYKDEIIENGHTWIDALEKRNLMAHTYDEETSLEAECLIREKYFFILKQLLNKLENER